MRRGTNSVFTCCNAMNEKLVDVSQKEIPVKVFFVRSTYFVTIHPKYEWFWINLWQYYLPFALGVLSSSDEFWRTWNLTFSFFTTIASKCPFEMLSRSSIISVNFSLLFLLAPRSSSTFSKNRCFNWLRFFWDRARYFAKSSADSSLTFLSLKSEMEKKI